MVVQLSLPGTGANGKTWRTAHRVVMEAFVGKRPEGRECNHKDGDKSNNRLYNLEWVTKSENEKHAHRIGLKNNGQGDTSYYHKLKSGEVWLIKKLLASAATNQRRIAKMFKIHFSTISHIKKETTWNHIKYP